MRERGGRLLAVSVDAPEENREVIETGQLPFSILSDNERTVLRDYGLLHAGGGPSGSDIAVPAQLLIDDSGRIAWSYVSRRIQQRAPLEETLAAIAALP